MRALYSLAIAGLLLLVGQFTYAQCTSCTYTISSNTGNGNYNLNSGQTLCILSGVTFSGNINMNGGTLCNSGIVSGGNLNINGSNSKVYNYGTFSRSGMNVKGQFYNYGRVELSGDLNINSDGEFYNQLGASLVVNGINNNKIFKNYGSVTVNGSYQANGGGTANLNEGTMTVKGNMQLNTAFINNGPLRVEGGMTVNGSASFTNGVNINVNVLGNYHNNGVTVNNGSIEVGNTFTNNGGGVYTNNESTNIYGNFMNNGVINGDMTGCNAFVVGGNSVVQNGGASITNNDFCAPMFPGSNFSTNNGSTAGSTFCTCSQGVNPLPIELTAFTASCADGGVELEWTTATEINNAFFTLYGSADAVNWETITVMAGAGNSNAELHYSYTDTRHSGSISYYRLQQTDYDGATEYFDPISVHCGTKGQNHDFSVYPNPADEQFTVSVTTARADAQASVELLDITGKRIRVSNWAMAEGVNYLTVERMGLASGTYFVHIVSAAGEFAMQKVVLR